MKLKEYLDSIVPTYYKVVRNPHFKDKPEVRLSYIRSENQLEYQHGVATVPKIEGSKLFIFMTEQAAWNFWGASANAEVWQCYAENAVPSKYCCSNSSAASAWWRSQYNDHRTSIVPYGTMFADSVTLIKQMAL